eukprot:845690-Rhodomonas_salina.1
MRESVSSALHAPHNPQCTRPAVYAGVAAMLHSSLTSRHSIAELAGCSRRGGLRMLTWGVGAVGAAEGNACARAVLHSRVALSAPVDR